MARYFPNLLAFLISSCLAWAQSSGQGGIVEGIITDPSNLGIPGATAKIENRLTAYTASAVTDASGRFRFSNLAPNPYHLEVAASGFKTVQQDVQVRSSVPVSLNITLALATETTEVEVHSEAGDLVESMPMAHTDISRELLSKLPIQSVTSGLSDAITLAAPGVVADSNGFFHPLGDHAQTGFLIDNEPITDQQSKQFSNQLPLNIIQSMEVISGAPPPEFGDKTGLVVNALTRSGLGQSKPVGSFTAHYGSFGTVGQDFTLSFGTPRIGNFLAGNSIRSGRYLDSPEFSPLHDVGNNQQIFDRFDFQPTSADTMHLNLFTARSWFQTPTTYDQQAAGQDQRQLIRSFNVAPGWLHFFSSTTALNISPFFRQDHVQYFPSRNLFSDVPATIGQYRQLSNLGVKADVSYAHGIHNAKAGVQLSHHLLTERFNLGLTDPAFNAICLTGAGDAVIDPNLQGRGACAAAGFQTNPNLQPGLVPYDLTRGGGLFAFRGHTDVKQEAAYLQDSLTLGSLSVMAGLRADVYRGLSRASSLQPRLGISYLIRPTSTVLRLSYSRMFETPYNENLVLSNSTGSGGLATNIFGAFGVTPLQPGKRNQYNAGMQQAFGRRLVVDADYIWKYTRNGYDFDNLFSTPIAFPISWRKSKIDGLSLRVNLTNIGGFSAFTVAGHTRARFFGPEIGGLIFNSPVNSSVFRIDHDQAFQQTTHLRYQYKKTGPWLAFTWRYDSGLVAGRVPDLAAALSLTADQQASIGLFCGGAFATLATPITSCSVPNYGATRIRLPAPGTANADTNPPRIAPRHLFDVGAGIDNLLRTDRPRLTLTLTAVNLTNKVALYNFLSTFSGTHFVTPRSYRAELGVVF